MQKSIKINDITLNFKMHFQFISEKLQRRITYLLRKKNLKDSTFMREHH